MTFFKKCSLIATAGIVIGALSVAAWQTDDVAAQAQGTKIRMPDLSVKAKAGKIAFDKTCAACHGKNAVGSDKGPPLIHNVYNPGHHGDAAFYNAVRRGSPQHHWRFGNMPPQPHVTDQEIAAIVRYVRELQEANGIVFRPHRMR